ncbi:MAG TPA: peptidylprolyl isomerase [Hyphomonadaceae bacterium]|nr:peptidylprolyl isomerase [Hyphomonadaceae bacterium]
MKRILVVAGLAAGLVGAAWAQEGGAGAPQAQWVGPEVTLQTSMGDIVITLDTAGAPKTAAQFLGLVKSGHYDGAVFYRVEPGFLIQLGDLDAKLEYRAPKLPPVALETENNRHGRGAVALAHADEPDSGQSTFYIDLAPNPHLNAVAGAPPNTTGYAVFGHVTTGMEVAEAIAKVELAPEGGPFPGKLPKVAVVVNKAVVTKE